MSESSLPWGPNKEHRDVFDYYLSEECQHTIAIPVGDSKAIEVVLALTSVYQTIDEDVAEAKSKVRLLAELLVSSVMGPNYFTQVEEQVLTMDLDERLEDFLEELQGE